MTVIVFIVMIIIGFSLFLLGLGMAINTLIKKRSNGQALGWGALALSGFLLTIGLIVILFLSFLGYAGHAAYSSIKNIDLRKLVPARSSSDDQSNKEDVDSVRAEFLDAQGKKHSIQVRASNGLKSAGIKLGRSSAGIDGKRSSFRMYLVFSKDFRGNLRLRLLDEDDRETIRSEVNITQTADSSRFLTFSLDPRADLASTEYAELEVLK